MTRASRSCTATPLRCSPAPQGRRSPKAPPPNPPAGPGLEAARKYAVIDHATGKLDRRIFSEQAIYDDEMEQIFGRAWLMIGHESLVPAADDFFHTYMGEDPVILTRDGEGRLHALLNMCRHRGNRVVRCDDGNAKRFMCTYHGWTYRNDGPLEYVPGESEAYYDALDRPSLGLIEARVETYAGIDDPGIYMNVRSGDFLANEKIGWRDAYDMRLRTAIHPLAQAAE
jgi:nitrite reductase/ring-hydroxylating ferredoxin subunit